MVGFTTYGQGLGSAVDVLETFAQRLISVVFPGRTVRRGNMTVLLGLQGFAQGRLSCSGEVKAAVAQDVQ